MASKIAWVMIINLVCVIVLPIRAGDNPSQKTGSSQYRAGEDGSGYFSVEEYNRRQQEQERFIQQRNFQEQMNRTPLYTRLQERSEKNRAENYWDGERVSVAQWVNNPDDFKADILALFRIQKYEERIKEKMLSNTYENRMMDDLALSVDLICDGILIGKGTYNTSTIQSRIVGDMTCAFESLAQGVK